MFTRILNLAFQVIAVLASLIGIVERPGEGAEKKAEVIEGIRAFVNASTDVPAWVRSIFGNATVLGFLVDFLVARMNAIKWVVASAEKIGDIMSLALGTVATLLSLIGMVERPGEGATKKAEVIAGVKVFVNGTDAPVWAKSIFTNETVLGFLIDFAVARLKATGWFTSGEPTTAGAG